MLTRIHGFMHREEAATAEEYALLLALIAIAAIAIWHGLGLVVAAKANGVTAALK